MKYETKIDAFEGPLDLLLHLIREAELDIHEVKISEITAQYLAYIQAMEDLHLEIASEYLVMAAQLVLIKSKRLLPKEESDVDGEYEEDPEEALRRRLLEYQLYKETLPDFRELEQARGQFFTKPAIDFTPFVDDHLKLDVQYEIDVLTGAFERLLRRMKLSEDVETTIVAEAVTIGSRIDAINLALATNQKVAFSQLFDVMTKSYVVVTFLAMLELVKSGTIRIMQAGLDEDIILTKVGDA